ncbi:MAG TPA: MotA/TolQ/ExbB proton channel family protein [Planctomycetaceae bacterium]|nr:MotA/TolQ/ExbB proton channel family protein [Planctomycetaceae bacterium]
MEFLLSPWLWGPALCLGFYLSIASLPEYETALARYFSNHPIQYAETGLFFLGLAMLLRKSISLVQEHRALKLIVVDAASLEGIEAPSARASSMFAATDSVPAGLRTTKLVGRIRDLCEYVACRGAGSSAAVEDHLRYLADLAVESLSSSYLLVRTIIWTTPVLGILGTVMAIATAIRSIDLEEPGASAQALVTGLGAAFDPTAQALMMSVVLAVLAFLLQRGESLALARIEQFGIGRLAPCLNLTGPALPAAPLAAAESKAAAHLLERTETLINWQMGLWEKAIEDLRGRWIKAAQDQQSQFSELLQKGMVAGLASHSQQLDEARDDFLTGFRAVGMELSRVTAGLQQMGEEHQQMFLKQVDDIWQALQSQMNAARQEQEGRTASSAALLENSVRGWHDDLSRATGAIIEQLQELQRHGQTLRLVAGQEEELVRLQSTLTHNLQSVRAVEAFEESIQSLNAAVHMLTIRAKAHAA